tara:strand:- start:3010 stop:7542 length:4533 start_codon:yes stop_codon:yes gene_type:complete
MASKPYIELPETIELFGGDSEYNTDIVDSTTVVATNEYEDLFSFVLGSGWYEDSSFPTPILARSDEDVTIKLKNPLPEPLNERIINSGGYSNLDTIQIFFYIQGQNINRITLELRGKLDEFQTIDIRGILQEGLEGIQTPGINLNNATVVDVKGYLYMVADGQNAIATTTDFSFTIFPPAAVDNEPLYTPIYEPFVANITNVDGDTIEIDSTYDSLVTRLQPESSLGADEQYTNWTISSKFGDRKDLNTYLHFGNDKRYLTTNVKYDNQTVPTLPYSVIYKTYEPIPDDINEKDLTYVVREVLPPLTETVELIGYEQEDEDVLVLIPQENLPENSPISNRPTELQSFDDLTTSDARLKQEIIDKYVSGSQKPVELSVDYSRYENFINFSSAEKRLENFKYKIEKIEQNTALSASFAATTNGATDAVIYEDVIRDVKSNFDGYENYLYNTKSTYVSSSIGEFHDASWPKDGSGTYADPYKPVSSSNLDFTTWYGSNASKTGQIYSASFYDTDNPNRLVNLLPQHITSNVDNNQFSDFMDMIGQQFDEIWSYIKALSDISDRRLDLQDGFSKDLIFNLVQSLGWTFEDGKDLLELSRHGFGQKLSGDSYSLYTSGSLDSPPEGDVSKEITKRLIASMPFLLKSKGTIASLRGLLNCYGIPATILKVREYGGLSKPSQKEPFEISRRFTKALGFRGSQYVSSSWTDDSDTSMKPQTVELRFRSVNSSDQVLVQKGTDWAIKLKDNDSTDNYGTVAFVLSGSDGYKTVSSSLLPIFDGDYYSLMLNKEKVSVELFPFPSFETTNLFNPPFITGSDGQPSSAAYGNIKIVSSSNVAKTGTNSLRHENNSNQTSYTYLFKVAEPSGSLGSQKASLANVSQNETYTFSAFAKASGSTVDGTGRLRIFELDENENVVNWSEDTNSNNESITALGGMKTSLPIGLDESEWRQISVTKTIRFPNTAKLGVRFENLNKSKVILWDDVSLRQVVDNTDNIDDSFSYNLFVKKYESGLDRTIFSSKTSLIITGSNNTVSSSYNAAWTGSNNLFIGGVGTTFGSQLTGSLMEFRLWNETLKEQYFDNHVSNPKSYVGNTPSSSYYSLVTRYSFDDNTSLSDGTTIRDVSSNQTTTSPGSANGFAGVNTFESVVDETKTFVPNHGPNRRNSDKIRIEDNFISGSGANLSVNKRVDHSSNDFAPIDSRKVGIYFSPTDAVNEDIVSSFANLDFNQYLGDPRDNFEHQYSELKDISNQYFQKYSDNNDFWDYMHLIKYYDQSVFKQIKKLIPMRSKTHLGTVVEPNIFERPKIPIQRNNPSFERVDYNSKINLTNFHFNESTNEASHSVLKIESDYPYYEGEIDASGTFLKPSLYKFAANDNFDDRNLYISGSAKYGYPDFVYQEPTGAMAMNQRTSLRNLEYKFFYANAVDYDKSSRYSINPFENFYSSRSLHSTDLDTEYQHSTAQRRMFFEGVKNTSETTIDGDLPFIVTTTAPTVAVPTTKGISKLSVDQKGGKKKIIPKKKR